MSLSWPPLVNWNTPAGKLLDHLIETLEPKEGGIITVFGSAALQLVVDEGFLSGDVDLFSDRDLNEAIQTAGLKKGQASVCAHFCEELTFQTSPKWKDRAYLVNRFGVQIRIPHQLDILISKLIRLEPKDLDAFRTVRLRTGHPTESELTDELQIAVDVLRPGFDEEHGKNPIENVRILWKELFDHSIDVHRQIIIPAIARRRGGYERAQGFLKAELRSLSKVIHYSPSKQKGQGERDP